MACYNEKCEVSAALEYLILACHLREVASGWLIGSQAYQCLKGEE